MSTLSPRALQIIGDLQAQLETLKEEFESIQAAQPPKQDNRPKLTESEVRRIRRLWEASSLSQAQIADMYDMHPSNISRLVRKKHYGGV